MKKYIFLLLFTAFAFISQAQILTLKSTSNNVTDTVTNTATEVLTSAVFSGKVKPLTVQVAVTKVSGTVAGSITLQYSLDGSNYFSLAADSVYTATNVASQSFGWKVTTAAKYVRVSYTGSGTMAAILRSFVYTE